MNIEKINHTHKIYYLLISRFQCLICAMLYICVDVCLFIRRELRALYIFQCLGEVSSVLHLNESSALLFHPLISASVCLCITHSLKKMNHVTPCLSPFLSGQQVAFELISHFQLRLFIGQVCQQLWALSPALLAFSLSPQSFFFSLSFLSSQSVFLPSFFSLYPGPVLMYQMCICYIYIA